MSTKYSFGNCLDEDNEIKPAPPFEYVPEIRFGNLKHVDHLRKVRFPALAGWRMSSAEDIFEVLNDVTDQVFSQFQIDGADARPANGRPVWQGREGFRVGHRAPCGGNHAHAFPASARQPFCPVVVGRGPTGGRGRRSARLRHVGHAVQLSGKPRANPRGSGPPLGEEAGVARPSPTMSLWPAAAPPARCWPRVTPWAPLSGSMADGLTKAGRLQAEGAARVR